MTSIITVFIGLGSNIDPEQNLRAAAAMLQERWPSVRFSRVYRSAPRELEDQSDFLNAVAAIETLQSPSEVKTHLENIEHALGKELPYRFGPRTIDLDLLLYDAVILPNETEWQRSKSQSTRHKLIVPHPRLHERRFVLDPLCELLPSDRNHPMLRESFALLLARVRQQDCTKTDLVL